MDFKYSLFSAIRVFWALQSACRMISCWAIAFLLNFILLFLSLWKRRTKLPSVFALQILSISSWLRPSSLSFSSASETLGFLYKNRFFQSSTCILRTSTLWVKACATSIELPLELISFSFSSRSDLSLAISCATLSFFFWSCASSCYYFSWRASFSLFYYWAKSRFLIPVASKEL